ncbi:putative methyltransferase-domain-containing protein [Pelagophyceae sp. CCMP2097]|nr:putative methyltransferase-domain-containing protein [Pelagophyceae sp. CCMP2097]
MADFVALAAPRPAEAGPADAEAASTEATKFAEAVRAFRRCDAAVDILKGLDLSSDRVQAFVVEEILDNAVSRRCPPRQSYVRKVVSAAISAAEKGGADVSDSLYERLASSMSDDTDERSYISFDVDAERTLSFRVCERQNELGLRLWPAAEVFAEWVLATKDAVQPGDFDWSRAGNVVELGAGIGLCGLVLAACGAGRVVLTDHQDAVVRNLRHVVATNGLEKKCSVADLDWERPDDFDRIVADGKPVDAVLAADCVYDITATASLAKLLRRFKDRGTQNIWLANAVRDQRTWAKCLQALEGQRLVAGPDRAADAVAAVAARGGPRLVSQKRWAQHVALIENGEVRLIVIHDVDDVRLAS